MKRFYGNIKQKTMAAVMAAAIGAAGFCAIGATSMPNASAVPTQPSASVILTSYNAPAYSSSQISVVRTIISVVKSRGLPQRAAVLAVDVGLVESGLQNLSYGDGSSVGVFQQTTGWGGTVAQRENVVWATNSFLDHLVAIPGWQNQAIGTVAYAIQRCAAQYAYRYGAEAGAAQTLVSEYWGSSSGSVSVSTSAHPTIRYGSTGSAVKTAQTDLNRFGAHLVVDGIFGPKTLAATKAFQASHGLVADGIIGPLTWAKLA